MKIAVVGATGNVGTAVLSALHQREEVTSVLGIARRMPDQAAEPYSHADWASIDIAAAVEPDEAISRLTEAFTGVDAVIHLAWLIQPNSERDLLRRVNVEGTRHVAEAAAAAGVPTLVVASSVGAYSPSPGWETRDESWPTGGVRTSHYSVDKAAQERVLDEFAAAHPQITLTRLRPALIFSADASSEIQRYFLASWIPAELLRAGRAPALPVPAGIRVQAVHSADVGSAYAAAAVAGRGGAFNICADDVLGVQELADIVDHGHYVEIPPAMVRAAVSAGHGAGLVAADAGWLDMGMNVPVMDNTRARTELDWQPTRSAAEALTELLDGMADGAGADSVPMRPREAGRAHLPVEPVEAGAGTAASAAQGARPERDSDDRPDQADRPDRADRPGSGAQISPEITQDLLSLYLSDHLTGASAGISRIDRMVKAFVGTPVYPPLSEIAEEIRSEHRFLQQLIHDLGFKQLPHRQAAAWAGEHLGRLKNNGRLLSSSPMTMVLEMELMRSAVIGKRGGWQTLHDNAEALGLDPELFAELADNAWRQAETLEEVHAYARRRAFREDLETFMPQA